MNAPLPSDVTSVTTELPINQKNPLSNEVTHLLSKRLNNETQGEILFSKADRGRYSTDASIYQITPVGVFIPRDQDDVKTALDICRDLKVPIVARGAGTSQCGQTVGAALVIDHSKYMRRILNVDSENKIVTVEPGLVLDHLNAALKPHGLWYPVDVSTSAQATLGGMAGNNSCGSRSIAYGNMVHNVEGVQAWLSDGELVNFGRFDKTATSKRTTKIGNYLESLAQGLEPEINQHWPKVLRRVAGYNLDIFNNQNERPYTTDGSINLAHILIGSEGTLALTRSLDLRLTELPRAKVLGVVNFPTFFQSMDAAQHIVKLGEGMTAGVLSAVELVDKTMIDLSLQNPAFAPTIRTAIIGQPAAILLVEFSGPSKDVIKHKISELVELMGDLGLPNSVVEMIEDIPQKNLWEVRKAGLNIMMSLKGDGKPVSFIEDCAVPLESLAEYTSALTEVFERHGSRGTWYAHASVGTLHVRPILDMRKEGADKMRAIAEEASALVKRFKGAYSGEHGDGLCRGEWIKWQFGTNINSAFIDIKNHFDPLNLFSPDRIINPPKMDDRSLMRYPKTYRVIPLATSLDWRGWDVMNNPITQEITAPGTGLDPAHGLAKAVDMCNNNGTCRKFDSGTMCPSYRVTRDEKHLTRGRANTLRLALSGQLDPTKPEQSLTHEAVHEALDLCVGCKGCKRECPTGVDMAKMKIEFLDHYKAKYGHTLQDKLIAHLPRYARFASQWAPIFNFRNRSSLLAKLVEWCFGLSSKRTLPNWQRHHFFNQKKSLASVEEVLSASKPVVLFVDTFNGYFESHNANDAVTVLQAAGYTVHVASKKDNSGEHLCCGRTYLTNGMVTQAKIKASELLAHLLPFAEIGIPIVGLEPSCLLTMRDEMLVMGLGEKAHILSQHAVLFEEFLAKEAQLGRLKKLVTQLKIPSAPILVHGHCHQKAFDAVQPIMTVLNLIPEAEIKLIESSCCGMAGSFGYQTEHYEMSMQMAELDLLPTIRKNPKAIVVADGTSCRHQISDGTQRKAIHVAKLLASLLKSP